MDKNKDKFLTTIVIETPYDPKDLGSAQLVIDAACGSAKIVKRVSKKITKKTSKKLDSI